MVASAGCADMAENIEQVVCHTKIAAKLTGILLVLVQIWQMAENIYEDDFMAQNEA